MILKALLKPLAKKPPKGAIKLANAVNTIEFNWKGLRDMVTNPIYEKNEGIVYVFGRKILDFSQVG